MMRREVVITAGAAALLSVAAVRHMELLDLFSDPARAISLGRAALSSRTAPPDPTALACSVLDRLPGRRAMAAEVAALIREDYAGGRIEVVDGWVLAATEVRLCSLAALRLP